MSARSPPTVNNGSPSASSLTASMLWMGSTGHVCRPTSTCSEMFSPCGTNSTPTSEPTSFTCLHTWGYSQMKWLTTWQKPVPMASHLPLLPQTTTYLASCVVTKLNGILLPGLSDLRPHHRPPWQPRPQGYAAHRVTQTQSAIGLMASISVSLTTESREHLPFSSLTPVPRSARSFGWPGQVYTPLSSLINILR